MNLLTIINGVKTFVRNIDFLDISNSAFRIRLTGTSTADRVVTIPNDSGTFLLDDRPVGASGGGVLLRGYEPLVTVAASKTLALIDACTVQVITAATAVTITIPLNATVAFPIGAHIRLRKSTAQIVTIALAAGVTVNNELGTANTLTTVANFTLLRKIGTDTWVAVNPIHNNANLPGDPTCITQSVASNNTRIATTAFVRQELVASTRPALEVNRPTSQAMTLNAFTALVFTTVQLDTNAAYNVTTGVFTVPAGQGGMYEYSIYAGFSSGGNNVQFVPVKNAVRQENLRIPGTNFTTDAIFYTGITFKIRLLAGDTLSFDCYFGAIATTAVTTSTIQFPSLSIYKVYS